MDPRKPSLDLKKKCSSSAVPLAFKIFWGLPVFTQGIKMHGRVHEELMKETTPFTKNETIYLEFVKTELS